MADPLNRFVPGGTGYAIPLLDRLTDAEPAQGEDPPSRPVDQLRILREAVRRDLEALLNTRRPPATPPAALSGTLVDFGIDGFVAANIGTAAAKLRFARALERRIELFEPRLSNVAITVLDDRGEHDRALRMRIHATFAVHEGMPPIRLESTVDPSTHRIEVEASHG